MKKKWLIIVIGIFLILWVAVGVVDFTRVRNFERPRFCILGIGADDGGSGEYKGLGYSFDIEGNFMPDEENPGVTSYTAKILGMPIESGIRD